MAKKTVKIDKNKKQEGKKDEKKDNKKVEAKKDEKKKDDKPQAKAAAPAAKPATAPAAKPAAAPAPAKAAPAPAAKKPDPAPAKKPDLDVNSKSNFRESVKDLGVKLNSDQRTLIKATPASELGGVLDKLGLGSEKKQNKITKLVEALPAAKVEKAATKVADQNLKPKTVGEVKTGSDGKGKDDGKGKNGGGKKFDSDKLGDNQKATQTILTPEQKKLQNKAMPFIKEYANETIKPPPDVVEKFTPEQKKGQAMALDAAKTQADLAKTGAKAQTDLLSGNASQASGTVLDKPAVASMADPNPQGTNFLTSGAVLNPNTNPALAGAIDAAKRPIVDSLLEEMLPAIRSEAALTGNFGSSRQGIAEGLAMGKASRAIGDVGATLSNEGYKSGLDAFSKAYGDILNTAGSAYGTKTGAETQRYGTQQGAMSDLFNTQTSAKGQALGLLPTTQGAQTTPAVTTSGVGEVKQAQQERVNAENKDQYLFKKYEPFNRASDLLSLMPALPGGATVSTGPVPQSNPITNALGGASIGATVGSAIPGLGTGIGAAVGGVGGLLSNAFRNLFA